MHVPLRDRHCAVPHQLHDRECVGPSLAQPRAEGVTEKLEHPIGIHTGRIADLDRAFLITQGYGQNNTSELHSLRPLLRCLLCDFSLNHPSEPESLFLPFVTENRVGKPNQQAVVENQA